MTTTGFDIRRVGRRTGAETTGAEITGAVSRDLPPPHPRPGRHREPRHAGRRLSGITTPEEGATMRQLTPHSDLSDLAGLPDVTVTLAPDGGDDTTVPLVGYLVLAPAGTQPAGIPGPSATDPSVTERADPAGGPASGAGGGLVIDEARRTVTADGRDLSLTYLEFELLAHLVRHPHRVYTRDQLVTSIWGYGPVGDQRTVDVHVARLRRKLGPGYRGRIVTIRRVGYKYAPAA